MQTNHHHHPSKSILPIFHTVTLRASGDANLSRVMTGNSHSSQHLIIKSLFLCLFGAVTAARVRWTLGRSPLKSRMVIRLESAAVLHFYPHHLFVLWPSLLSATMT